MSKKEKQVTKPQAGAKKESVRTVSKQDLFDRLNNWFEKHDKKVFYTLLFLSTLFSLLLFDSKVSDGGDDSSYIERAWSLLKDGKFPYYQGPGYPIFLSFFVKMFGLNVIALKLVSVACQFGFVWFTYKAFVKRVPYLVLFALIAFISLNSYILYYSSQTFTETFFLFIQSICFYLVFKIIDSIRAEESLFNELKANYLKWILFGFLFVLLSISKSVAIVAVVAVVIYFLLNRNFKQVLFVIASFILIRLIYTYVTTAMYGPSDSDQFEMILRKELYKKEAGYEDLGGMITRFFNNFNTYMSLHIYRIMNLRKENYELASIVPQFAYITVLILSIYTWISYRKNKFVFFSSIYLAVLCGGIFFGIQAANMQDRLIIIVMPFIFLLLFYGTYELVKRSSFVQGIFVIFASVMLIITVGKSAIQAKKNTTALKKNLSGDIYYGYTPDWENFLKMSKYCADSLPENAKVISRKPSMSFLYGDGKKFVGQYMVTSMDADTVLMSWKKLDVQYVLLGNLRMNPKKNNGRVINTVQRMLGPVYQKYPQKVKLIKSIGTTEKSELYEIKY
jgi:hypothetical protein